MGGWRLPEKMGGMEPTKPTNHRQSIRLPNYDYSQPGAYFITIVSFQRQVSFGKIENNNVILTSLGKIIRDEWFQSFRIRQEIDLKEDELVIMPNHLHGIVWITNVGADGVRLDGIRPENLGAHRAPLQRYGRTLGSFVAGFKSAVSSRAKKELGLTNIWQCNYYEHIIRNDCDYANVFLYMQTNPQRWQEDYLFFSINML